MENLDSVTAIILSGGKSTRMGNDKGMSLLHDKELVSYTLDLLTLLFNSIIIVANDSAYRKYGYPVYEDLVKDSGPIGGIFTGLSHSKSSWNFFIACDMPFMTKSIIEKLSLSCYDCDAVIPVHQQFPEPLCAFYNQSSLPVVENQIKKENNKLQSLLPLLNVKKVDFSHTFLAASNPFLNVNTGDELLKLNKS